MNRWKERVREFLLRWVNRIRVRSGDLNMLFHHYRMGWVGSVTRLSVDDVAMEVTVTDPFEPSIAHRHCYAERSTWLVENAYFHHRSGVVYLNGNAIRDSARPTTKRKKKLWITELFAKRAGPSSIIPVGQNVANYYHWLLEELPAIARAKAAVPSAPVIVSSAQPDWVFRTLEMAGIEPVEKTKTDLREARLVLSAQGSDSGWPHPSDVSKVRQLFEAHESKSGLRNRRLFISRPPGKRGFLNEEAICSWMESRGIQVVKPEQLALHDQVKLFSEAALVVGAHGAAMTNIVFCQPDTQVIELALDLRAIQVFEVLSLHCKLRYDRVLLPTRSGSELVEVGQAALDDLGERISF